MARSPRGSMQIADIEDATPGTRGQDAVSTCSPARAATMRSPIASAPAGPPSGPAKRARPPSRAIATAALAAQPPEMIMNSDAWVLASGTGNWATRKTASSTAMPVQTTSGPARRVRQRRGQALGMSPQEHQRDLVAVEPAGVVELGPIDDDLARACLRVAADH